MARGKRIALFRHDLFYASNLSIHQADLDSMRVIRRLGEYIFHNALGQFARALILFKNDQYGHAGFDVGAGLSVHGLFNF